MLYLSEALKINNSIQQLNLQNNFLGWREEEYALFK